MESVDAAEWVVERVNGARVLARAGAAEPVRSAVARAGSLFSWAVTVPGAQRLEGRGPAYRVRLDGGDWLVRHYRRGGAVAVHLGDRYVRAGTPRPFRETEVSRAARARGIATPGVVAAVVYPAGIFYRGDIAVEFIPRSRTLADALFGAAGRAPDAVDVDAGAEAGDGSDRAAAGADREHDGAQARRAAAARAAGAAIRQAHDRGLAHPDLNIRNILLAETGGGLRGYILDLDGARVVDVVDEKARSRMIRRFWRSVRKWQAQTGRVVSDGVQRAFDAGYATGSAHE